MATVNVGTLIRSVAAPPPPPPRTAAHSVPTAPRRLFLLLCSAAPATPFITSASSSADAAFSLGIPGPKEWLREQKKKAAKYVLAPIDASRQTLRNAYQLLEAAPDSAAEKTKELRSLLYSAARDCVPEQRNSLVAFQSQTGVEVCTFRLLVNNAASLLDNGDPVKLEAEARLAEVIRLFSSIGSVINQSNLQLDSDREKLKEGLTDTISALDEFEQGIRDCLGI
ncbi:hypothetical protein ACMD2_01783 [Ananas comosus]|uniref:Uncharacterized protein n=1 Tax=Ananas comosus TaxID=4615 RepID=A0A199VWN9_ANACO|nr:hypothetical protein ACMD2_01783 [Ananas comosus]